MLSYGDVFLTLIDGTALLGPKDIPIFANAAGRFMGKAVGYMQSARGQLNDVMKRSRVDQVHKELEETLAQLEAIRYEIRSGMSISNPGPLTRSILSFDVKPDSPGSPSIQTQTVVAGTKDTPNLETSKKTVSDTQELHRASLHSHIETGGFETVSPSTIRVTPVGFPPGPDGTFNTMPASTGRIAAQGVVVKPVGIVHAESPQLTSNSTEGMQDMTVLPISAVGAGLLPPRTGGAELVLESWTERDGAFDTMKFFHKTDPTIR